MSDFLPFCRALGLVIDSIPPIGKWVRVPTLSHPRKRNGAVKYLGTHAFVQDHATMQEVVVWTAERGASAPAIDHDAIRAATQREHARIAAGRAKAAAQAKRIVNESNQAPHAYLSAKGFPDATGLVWQRDDGPVLVVPMRVGKALVGAQLIAEDGSKRFLPGQLCAGASFIIGQGSPIYCEGYATALSVRQALTASRMRASIVVCFSAHNLQRLAHDGIVIADNDESKTGERAAQATGRPYWMSKTVGNDFNDDHQARGLFAVSQELKAALAKCRSVRGDSG